MLRHVSRTARAKALDAALGPLEGPEDLCVVLGGDGTMLAAVRLHPTGVRFLGLNCGGLGFLLNEVPGEPADVASRVRTILAEGRMRTVAFPRLRMRAGPHTAVAVNDVYIERASESTCHLKVTVDEVVVVERMVCDGLIVATPLGSTAYSLSAGGPAAHPLLRATHLTPVCPHRPRLEPLVLPPDARVKVEVLDAELRPARVVVDGEAWPDVELVEVGPAPDDVHLCFFEHHQFTRTLVEKVLRT